MERRNRRTWGQLILGVVVQRSTRLLALGRVVAPQRRAGSVKSAAQGVAYFLREAKAPGAALSTSLLEEAVRQLDPTRLVTYHGKVLVVLDPTECCPGCAADDRVGLSRDRDPALAGLTSADVVAGASCNWLLSAASVTPGSTTTECAPGPGLSGRPAASARIRRAAGVAAHATRLIDDLDQGHYFHNPTSRSAALQWVSPL